jgi:selenocysteine lyase/cysteine desulfurase
MTLLDHRSLYSRFLKYHEGKLHFAAHSHHFWPDVTREAQLNYWDDCARSSDEKWNKIFSEVIPETQGHIAKILYLKKPAQIVLAPNTHELLTRVLSLFLGRPSLEILTTQSEFHSWKRQLLRLTELPTLKVTQVPAEGFLENRQEFLEKLSDELAKAPDLFFMSQVFFDSGLALTDDELEALCLNAPEKTLLVIDGYHSFAALPTSLAKLEGRIFFLGGGYKYAQAGEGVGFMVVPEGDWRPAYTGWFAEYGELTQPKGSQVGYPRNGMAFMGATQDPSGFYRFNAVWNLLNKKNLDITKIHSHVRELQLMFLAHLPQEFLEAYSLRPCYEASLNWHGHFLTYRCSNLPEAEEIEDRLKKTSIIIDRRGSRLRFGFGLYHSSHEVMELCEKLKNLI